MADTTRVLRSEFISGYNTKRQDKRQANSFIAFAFRIAIGYYFFPPSAHTTHAGGHNDIHTYGTMIMTQNLIQLNHTYGIDTLLAFHEGPGGLPTAVITTASARAEISLYGAQVLSYEPAGKTDVLWMSSRSIFKEGKAIRGGIPLCFPWFGAHADDPSKPQHGFARLTMWDVVASRVTSDGTVELHLAITETPATMALWPHAFRAELIVTVGSSLDVTLRCTNTGAEAFTYTDALHTYCAVDRIDEVSVEGLEGTAFLEGRDMTVEHQTEEHLEIRRETNRRYLDTACDCLLHDRHRRQTLRVAKQGSRVTVVWNPWTATTKSIADMADDGYETMLCIEAVNTLDDAVTLAPGASHSLGTRLTVE